MSVKHRMVAAMALASLTTAVFAGTPAEHDPGYTVYAKWCAPCHAPGISHPGTNALMEKYKGVKSGVLLEWTDLPPVLVKHWVRTGISVMPQFRKTEIS